MMGYIPASPVFKLWEFKQLISLVEGSWVEMTVAVGYKSAISGTCMGIDMVSVSEVSPSS